MGGQYGYGYGANLRQRTVVGTFDPVRDLGSDLLAYWDAEDGETLSLVEGRVSAWADVLGNCTPSQTTDSARPVYHATGFNGRPCIETDGISQQLVFAPVPEGFPIGGEPCEIWFLGEQKRTGDVTALNVPFGYGNTGTNGQGRYIGRVGSSGFNRLRVVGGTGSALISASGTNVDVFGPAVIRGQILPDETIGEINGQEDGRAAGALAGTTNTRIRIGASPTSAGSNFFMGTINKIIVTRPLSDGVASRLRRFLANIGGITLYGDFDDQPDPSEWAAIPEIEPFVLNGEDYHIDSASKPYSIMQHVSGANLFRFEIRHGDEWLAGDGARPERYDRAELGTYWNQGHPVGQEQWYAFSLKARGVYSDGVRSIFQLFNEEVELQMVSTPNSLFWRTYAYPDGTIGSITPTVQHTAAGLVDNTPEDFVIRALPISDGGELQVWRNGIELFNATGFSFGTMDAKKTHKFGAYRLIKPDPFVIEFANFQYGTDLSTKVATPDPHPPLWT